MDNFETIVIEHLRIVKKATTKEIQSALQKTRYEGMEKANLIRHLKRMANYNYIRIEEGEIGNHGGRKPLYFTLGEIE